MDGARSRVHARWVAVGGLAAGGELGAGWCSRALPNARVGRSPQPGRAHPWRWAMSALLVGHARCSTDQQDLTAQRDALSGLGVEAERIYVHHGLTGTNRERPGLRPAGSESFSLSGQVRPPSRRSRRAARYPDRRTRRCSQDVACRQCSLPRPATVGDVCPRAGLLGPMPQVPRFRPKRNSSTLLWATIVDLPAPPER